MLLYQFSEHKSSYYFQLIVKSHEFTAILDKLCYQVICTFCHCPQNVERHNQWKVQARSRKENKGVIPPFQFIFPRPLTFFKQHLFIHLLFGAGIQSTTHCPSSQQHQLLRFTSVSSVSVSYLCLSDFASAPLQQVKQQVKVCPCSFRKLFSIFPSVSYPLLLCCEIFV